MDIEHDKLTPLKNNYGSTRTPFFGIDSQCNNSIGSIQFGISGLDAKEFKNSIIDTDRKRIKQQRYMKKRKDVVEGEYKGKLLEEALQYNFFDKYPQDTDDIDRDIEEIDIVQLVEIEDSFAEESNAQFNYEEYKKINNM